ncbi:MAG: aldehyde dehydrogenase EutE [Caldilineaceae bacterium]|nr:aldehyde dehydrogenase EutE [Caldilineaceae bacterium]
MTEQTRAPHLSHVGRTDPAPFRAPQPERLGLYPDIDRAVGAARHAFLALDKLSLESRRRIVEAIRGVARRDAAELGRMAAEETGLGRPEDKEQKNLLVANRTPGPEILQAEAISGDNGLTLTERAPYGVVAAITPSTNPTSTIFNNAISILSAGNGVVFNVHPGANRVCNETIRRINRAITAAGGPPDLLTAPEAATIESAQALMTHPGVRLLLVTGGPGVVREAMRSGKRAICAGPGNPPVVVDESADIGLAARQIVFGASFDNNVICSDEKEVFVVRSVADELLAGMQNHSALLLPKYKLAQLEKVIFAEMGAPGKPGVTNKRWVGKYPWQILREIGIEAGPELRLIVVDVPAEHPLVWTEQLMPVLPVVRVENADEAIDLAVAAEHGFGHTAAMYSRNIDNLSRMAREINCSIFVKNGPTLAGLGYGGEGYTSFSIASPTGEGLTTALTFSRIRRCTMVDHFRIV